MLITSTKAEVAKRVCGIVYAPSGHGKTTLARTLDKPLILSYESGTQSLSDLDIPMVDMTKNDKGEPLSGPARIAKITLVFRELLKDENKAKFNTIFVDSLTEIGELVFSHIEDDLIAKARAKDKEHDNRQTYGKILPEIKDLVKEFRDMPHYDVVFSCLEASGEDEITGAKNKTISLPGARLKAEVPGLCDFVVYLEKKREKDGTDKRGLLTSSDSKHFAKVRVPDSIKIQTYEPPDLGAFINKIKGVK